MCGNRGCGCRRNFGCCGGNGFGFGGYGGYGFGGYGYGSYLYGGLGFGSPWGYWY